MNFNTDQVLWENYLKANPTTKLWIMGGDIWSDGDGHLGRFKSTEEAVKVLTAAGYSTLPQVGKGKMTIVN